ncbi:MAG: CotH kinase family protein, partial [Chloroflexota bacterium]
AFLKWLAISAIIQHWDAYGNMSHNYYLYDDPETGQLTWISWDNNMAMSAGIGSGDRRGGRAARASPWTRQRLARSGP